MKKKVFLYIVTLLLSILYIVVGNVIAGYDSSQNPNADDTEYIKAKVVTIQSAKVSEMMHTTEKTYMQTDVTFTAQVISGSMKGETLTGHQTISDYASVKKKQVEEGDKIILIKSSYSLDDTSLSSSGSSWEFAEYVRSDAMIALGLLFVGSVLFFGRGKGINTIISLALTCLAVILVHIPAVLAGKNIYLWTAITCIYMIVMTLTLVNGYNKKTLAAILGCTGGVGVSALLCLIMQKIIFLTGFVDEQEVFLLQLNPQDPVDLVAIVYSAILIGAVGAIMDVSVDISSSLAELSRKLGKVPFGDMFASGVRIGRDIMGTMANTLVLAYIGSSLSTVLLLSAYNTSMLYLFNMENIVIEMLQSLVGSLGILFCIPLTAAISSFIYNLEKKDEEWFMQ